MVAMPICMMPCVFSPFKKLNTPNMKPAMPKITGKIKNETIENIYPNFIKVSRFSVHSIFPLSLGAPHLGQLLALFEIGLPHSYH